MYRQGFNDYFINAGIKMEATGPERPDLRPNLSPYSAADKICR
jgi:hypothetical protein